jgi:hypothetical protein
VKAILVVAGCAVVWLIAVAGDELMLFVLGKGLSNRDPPRDD